MVKRASQIGKSARQGLRLVVTAALSMAIIIVLCAGDWPMLGKGLDRGGFANNEFLTSVNPMAKVFGSSQFTGGVTAQPVVSSVTGQPVLYEGGQDGYERAFAVNNNYAQLWQTNLGTTAPVSSTCTLPDTFGITSTAAVAVITGGPPQHAPQSLAFVGGNDYTAAPADSTPYVYALNAATGAIAWRTSLVQSGDPTPTTEYISSSPAVYTPAGAPQASVYIGLAANDHCQPVQGKVFQLNALTGAIQNTFDVVATGCQGGGVWSSPAIDAARNTVFIATGDAYGSCTEPYAMSLLALDASMLTLENYGPVPTSQQIIDGDFGATTMFFQENVNGTPTDMVGLANKNGWYYAFRRADLTTAPYQAAISPIWNYQVAIRNTNGNPDPVSGDGSIATSADDPTLNPVPGESTQLGTLSIAGGDTPISDNNACPYGPTQGSVQAFDLNVDIIPTPPTPVTPSPLWQVCFDNSGHPLNPTGDGHVLGPVTALANTNGTAPYDAIVGEGNWIAVVDGSTGTPTVYYTPDPSGTSGTFYGGASVAGTGTVYIGDVVQQNGQFAGYLYGFT
jgi:outer membrane protein assembly factor BamB